MSRIIFATGNENKVREIKEIFQNLPYEVVSMKEANVFVDAEENGSSFEENALIKARAVAAVAGEMVMADDSGLEVDYMDKAPGIMSARFMGYDTSYDVKNQAILDKLSGVPFEQRTARFVCAIAAVLPDGREYVLRGTMEGHIGDHIAGENGFGYDPIFFLEEYGCTSAEISPEEKNAISHRGTALRKMRELLLTEGVLVEKE